MVWAKELRLQKILIQIARKESAIERLTKENGLLREEAHRLTNGIVGRKKGESK